ncbi:hypothetical protein KKE19_01705 [Patescibacteria group bacterium]|nr:hypothetical protein [Patescibacteria group bacterium]MBU4274508.1 hypothetical protein [Patescibacteria group bacterium]MBU4367413.1 hypothetical protein [Patescibacteria group bacterium]MBU4461733.1 hypothetical protein [Patescibacteria group bacterium]MCG2700117.1 hypothetical protein [Candidatus Parcubacteria bacterium]
MALEIRKKERESSQNLVHRFTKTIRQSGILLETRKRQFHKRAKSDLVKKRSALRKEESRKKYEKAKKLSKPQ